MSMVITCESCSSRFRFDEGLLKGAKGALVKCPRCSERILVRNPAAPRVTPPVVSPSMPRKTPPIDPRISTPVLLSPPVSPPTLPLPAPPAAIDTKPPPIQGEGQGGMISLVPPERHAAGADGSARIGSDPGHALPDEITLFPSASPGSVSLEIPGKQAQRVADLFRPPSEAEAGGNLSGDEVSSMEDRGTGPAWKVSPPRPLYQRPLFIAAAIFVLLLSGGAFYYVEYVDGNSGWKPPGPVVPAPAQNASEQPAFDVQNLKGDLNKQATGERLYVIKGTVTNVGKTASSGIRIRATLLGKDNQVIMQNETFAGNLIDESLMPHMNRVRIEGFLGMRYGDRNVNRDIPVGTSLPFMVVFFDPPEGVESFTVKAMNVDEAETLQSSHTEKTGTRVSSQQPIQLN
ncbi:DUF3426 domain-containing protein [Candidatus Deferrimicrobium sp.]|uniref:DUF3426 domain-containing protein n=1 Tax=Candidatus Deferrimicrobium sp. TaxID=3060586 RepID=UPI003C574636